MALAAFTLFWLSAIYLFNSALARSFKKIDLKIALLYTSTVALIGVFGEVFSNTLYTAIVGTPLWQYHVFPVHHGHTSMYSVVVWGMYGFYLYLLHDNLSPKNYAVLTLAAIISIEAIILEILLNFSHFIIFKDYFFYYLPGDLWHFSTLQAVPFYFLAGLVIIKTLKRFKVDPVFFTCMNIFFVGVFIFIAG